MNTVRELKPEDEIYDLVDVVKEGGSANLIRTAEESPRIALSGNGLSEEIMKKVSEITERIAREMIPDIAERVIKEEIDKLKREMGER